MHALKIQPWMRDAACRDMSPDIFFPPRGCTGAEAKAICATCTVVRDCLDFAIHAHPPIRAGVFGGMNARERDRIARGTYRPRAPRKRAPLPPGTRAGQQYPLAPNARRAYDLRRQGVDLDDIAEELGLTRATVDTYLWVARAHLEPTKTGTNVA